MAKTVEDLLAEAEIKDIQIRYCRGADRRDEALQRSCFHPDAVLEFHKELTLEEFLALGRTLLSNYTVTWHNTGNQLVEVRGDQAWAEHYAVSSHRIAASDANDPNGAPERDFVCSGRYIDRLEKRDGEWKILRRKMVVDFTRTDPVPPGEVGLGSSAGARDRSDPSYAMRLEP